MKITHLVGAILLVSSLPLLAKQSNNEWHTVPVAKSMEIIDDQGLPETITPACALDSIDNPQGGSPLDNSFKFYFKQGKSKNVLIYFNGGGACWNDSTCVASLALASVPGDRPTYNPSILADNSPIDAGGVFDDDNGKNPFKHWSKVYIPYCTGDLHAGSKTVTYTDVDGAITQSVGAPFPVNHRGYDNFMAVREWMKNYFNRSKDMLEKVLVTGSSAGGYGATLNFPYVQAAFPQIDVALFADASASVVTEGFINDVFNQDGNWNLQNSLPHIFSSALGIFTAEGLNVELFLRLSNHYPDNRFAQYNTELDAVQVQFLKVMDQIDIGNTNPYSWLLSSADFLYFAEWNFRMTSSFDFLSENTDNYQYYIGEGYIHTILTDEFATSDVPHPFYDEKSAQNVKFRLWLDRFANKKKFSEKSVKH